MKKKNTTSLTLLIVIVFLMLGFSACQKLSITNLKANNNLKLGNGYYQEEKFKKAAEAYEKALALNPELKMIYFHVATSYASAYKPMKDEFNLSPLLEKIRSQDETKFFAFLDCRSGNVEKYLLDKLKQELEKDCIIQEIAYNAEDHTQTITALTDFLAADAEPAAEEAAEGETPAAEPAAEKAAVPTEAAAGEEGAEEEAPAPTEKLYVISGFPYELFYRDEEELTENFKQLAPGINTLVTENNFKCVFFYPPELGDALADTVGVVGVKTPHLHKYSLFGEIAIHYLGLARELDSENIKIAHVLGDLYEKMNQIDKAEAAYLEIMEKSEENPKTYYVLANFYQNHGELKKAEAMYKRRIEMDPENPEGYHYIAGYYQNRSMWYEAIENYELRISAYIDPGIVKTHREVLTLNEDVDKIKGKKQYLSNVRKNKAIPAAQRNELGAKIQKELDELGTEAELATKIEEKRKEVAALRTEAEGKIAEFPQEKKNQIAEAYYMLGLVLWNQSHQTSPEYMGPKERMLVIEKGMAVLNKANELRENYYEPWAIIALLHLQKITANPLKEVEYRAQWKVAYDKAISIRERNMKRERLRQELEQMGETAAEEGQ
ncbi:MAG: tetratricopeptide repeat protein [Candidatus Aminicenantes bacterium]|nr:tetratricopeptide repeat protein [Candidatus Aminicenantes bacterium]